MQETYTVGADHEMQRLAAITALGAVTGSSAGRIAMEILMPGEPDLEYPLERVNDGTAGTKSAISRTTSEFPSNFQLPVSGTGSAFHAFILKRQFGRFCLLNDSNPQNNGYCYTWQGVQLQQQAFAAGAGTTQVRPVGATAAGLVPTGGSPFQPHGTQLCAGYIEGVANYVWLDATANTSSINVISLAGTNLPNTLTVKLYQAIDDEDVFISQVTAAGGVPYVRIPVSSSGYYRIEFVQSNTAAAITGLTVFSACGPVLGTGVPGVDAQLACNNLWMHLSVPSLLKDLGRISSLRFIGGSARLMNTQADLFQNGQIAAATIGDGEDWQVVLTNGTNLCNAGLYNAIASYAESNVKKADSGFYTHLTVNDIEDFHFANEVQKGASDSNGGVVQFPLLDKSPYQAMCVSVSVSPQLGNPSTTVVLRSVFEYYSTVSQLRDMELNQSSIEDLQAAIDIAAKSPRFYDNPGHIRRIATLFGAFLPVLGNLASMALKKAGGEYAGFADFASAAGEQLGAAAGKFGAKSKRARAGGA